VKNDCRMRPTESTASHHNSIYQQLRDRVADNNIPHDLTESESFLIGTHFGVVTDIETDPDDILRFLSQSAERSIVLAHLLMCF
jgi:hypothetical protein